MTRLLTKPYRPDGLEIINESLTLFLLGRRSYGLLTSILLPGHSNVVSTMVETELGSTMSIVLELEKELTGLKELLIFRNVAIVEDYLKRNYTLIETLLEAYLEIEKRFGFDPQICLEIITDPETPQFEQLVAFIRTTMNAEDAFDALTSLEEEWWLEHTSFTTGLLCIHLECI